MEIRVPQLAEGIDSGTVVRVLVKEGDEVQESQDVLELETKKAVAPIPAGVSGKVQKILVKEGDEVAVGQAVIVIEGARAGKAAAPSQPQRPKPESRSPVQQRPREEYQEPAGETNGYTYESKSGFPPPASPYIRKIARELGIDLTHVRGSESGGRIMLDDVKAYIQSLQRGAFRPSGGAAPAAERPKPAAEEAIDFSKWGPVRKEPLSAIRKVIYQRMSESWTTIPHVTQYDDADITGIMELKDRLAASYEKKGARLTVTSFILKALVNTLKKHPVFNCSITTSEVVYKEYINLGIAVDTESGLVVPVLKNVDKKSMLEISKELPALVERTRARKNPLDELQGGTFTVSNQGGLGGGYFTPIINKPEVAILGIGQGSVKPVYNAKKKDFEKRSILPLCLSYDHRIIDGANAVRFIVDLRKALEEFDEKDAKA